MQKNYTSYRNGLKAKYHRLKQRIERAIRNGRFYRYTWQQQQQLLRRLQRYYQQLLRSGQLLIPTAVAGLMLTNSSTSHAQLFTEITTTASPFIPVDTAAPFGLTDVGDRLIPAFIDVDGDGDLDAFVGEFDGNINYFENTNSGAATSDLPVFVLSTSTEPFGLSDIGNSASPAFVDIDQDGDLDAFVGEIDGNTNYFENTNSGAATSDLPVFMLSTSTEPFGLSDVGRNSNPTFVDIDQDGDLDAFVGEFNGNINYFENTNSGAATTDLPVFVLSTDTEPFGLSNVGLDSNPTFVDIDQDGDLDVIVGEYYGFFKYFENTNSGAATTDLPIFSLSTSTAPFGLTEVSYYANVAFVDVDQDGDLDAFTGEDFNNISYLENINCGAATTDLPVFAPAVIDVVQGSTPFLADIDGDGDDDLFIGDSYGNINYYENTNSGAATSDLPVFKLSYSSEPFGISDVGSYSYISLIDIDNDGDLDAFVGEEDGNINYFENIDTSTDKTIPTFSLSSSTEPFGLSDVGMYSAPTFVDIDGDGDLDAFVGESSGDINYFENTDTSVNKTNPVFSLSSVTDPFGLFSLQGFSFLSFADIDQDEDLDAFIGGIDGNISYFENTDTSTDNSLPFFNSSSSTGAFGLSDVGFFSAPTFADLDRDGDLDAIIGEGGGNINYFENNSEQKAIAVQAVTVNESSTCSDETTTFVTISLDAGTNFCDLDGDATYTPSVSPAGQGVTASVVGTGADDCEFTIEITSTADATVDEYSIGLTIEDPDGVNNNSDVSGTSNSAGNLLFLNLGMFEVQGCGIIVNDISINTAQSGVDQSTTFLDITLDERGCDTNGDAIYSTTIAPNNQGLTANVVGTGTGNCTFTVEVVTAADATLDNYDINLVIEDPDGITNNATIPTLPGSNSTFAIFEPQSFEVTDQGTSSIEVSNISLNNSSSCKDKRTAFSTVTLTPDKCDFDGDAIYTATIVPAGQGVTTDIVFLSDCSFYIYVIASDNAVPDEYAINLTIEDVDGVTDISNQTNTTKTDNQNISYNLGTFKVLGDVDVTTINGTDIVAANATSEFAVNITNTNANTTYDWTVAGTSLSQMIGDGTSTGSAVNIDLGSGNFIEVSATTVNVADNVTKSVLTISNPQDADSQTFDIQLVAANPCGTDMEMKNNIVGLPVELTYFDAEAFDDYTLLKWETASELNNDYFSIERSYNARTFETIGQVQGAGTSIQAQQYDFVDRTVDVRQEDVYYRLQQVDYDQSYVYTDIKAVAFEQAELFLEISPNPTSDQLVIKNGIGSATITNSLGQVVRTFLIDNKVFALDVSALASGQYILTVEQLNGTVAVEQFVK